MNKKATSTRIKTDAAEFAVPQTRDEVAEAIAKIGFHQRERQIIETAMNELLAQHKAGFEAQAKPHADAIGALIKGVHTWCEANRTTITQEGRVKFCLFATGEVKWRFRPPAVSIRGGAEKVAEALKSLGLTRFLRTKEEIDKEAILKEPEAVKSVRGVSIVQKEDFAVVPFETKLEEVQ
jgi:phage host-nuclease inhibitor protein Gam